MKAIIALFATICLSGCTSLAGNLQVKMMTPSSEENQNFKTFQDAEYFDVKHGDDSISVQSQGDADGRIVLVFGGIRDDAFALANTIHISLPSDNIVSMRYPGYGKSSGSPEEKSIIKNGVALAKMFTEQGRKVILVGYSLGTGVATAVAAELPNHAVEKIVLIAPYDSLREVVRSYTPFFIDPLLEDMQHAFHSVDYLQESSAPVTIIEAGNDRPRWKMATQRLKDSIPKERLTQYEIVAGADHTFVKESNPWYNQERLSQLFQKTI